MYNFIKVETKKGQIPNFFSTAIFSVIWLKKKLERSENAGYAVVITAGDESTCFTTFLKLLYE